MANLKNVTTNTDITHLVSVYEAQKVNRVENWALDGTYYLQLVGEPNTQYIVTAYLRGDEYTDILSAESNGDILCATVTSGTYYGRISSLAISKLAPRDLYKATIALAKEAGI